MDPQDKPFSGSSGRLGGAVGAILRPSVYKRQINRLTDGLMLLSALLILFSVALKPSGYSIVANGLWIAGAVVLMVLWVRLLSAIIKTALLTRDR